jgi:DNA-binding PadR family transcriptional regulator
MKRITTKLDPENAIKPSTFYSRIEKLEKDGKVQMDDDIVRITGLGRKYITDINPDLIKQAFDLIPKITRELMYGLPFSFRVGIISDWPDIIQSPKCNFSRNIFGKNTRIQDENNIDTLEILKKHLTKRKKVIQERTDTEITRLTQEIKEIDQHIEKLRTNNDFWRTITIEDADSKEKEGQKKVKVRSETDEGHL